MFSKWVSVSALLLCLGLLPCSAGELVITNSMASRDAAAAQAEAERALKRFRLEQGHVAELFAAEPLLENPVCFAIDEGGRFFVAETFRLHEGVTDIRAHMNWLDDELASTSVEDRVAYMKKFEGKRITSYTLRSDRVRVLWDNDKDGKADVSRVFADGFNEIADGLGAGLLAYRGSVYYANIPNLWVLRDENRDYVADSKRSMHYGFGVRVGFLGHDLHGLRMGPDGKLYFSVGDRGANVATKDRKAVVNLEDGAVYRCDPNGLNLEIFARGLRNPQELAFDEFGNLWTGDNNSDGGDPARWVYVVEGGDSGWRIGYQFIQSPSRGPWNTERMCYPYWHGQPAYIVPPIANIGNGPSGLTFYPGVGLSPRYRGHFFMADFRGTTRSGIHSFAVQPRGAGFDVIDRHDFIWDLLPTDCEFGYDGSLYVSDWVEGWNKPGKGRLYRISDPIALKTPVVTRTAELVKRGIYTLAAHELVDLLSHPDMRVRQEAQFTIVERGPSQAYLSFTSVLGTSTNRFARIHAIWGLGQIARKSGMAVTTLNRALRDKDPEVRAQAAKVLGDNRTGDVAELTRLLRDESRRIQAFAAQALGKIGLPDSIQPVADMLRAGAANDPYLRHAGVMALTRILETTNTEPLIVAGRKHEAFEKLCSSDSDEIRMGSLLALRRLESPAVSQFLRDSNSLLVAEAARAINDLPITNALPALALLAHEMDRLLELPLGDSTHPGPRDAVLVRVLNANFRLGKTNHAAALADFAGNSKVPEAYRVQALTMLGQWERPSNRDAVTGLWRPLSSRHAADAAAALEPVIGALEKSSSDPIRVAATRTAGALNLKSAGFDPYTLLQETTAPATVRVEALRSLAAQKDARLTNAVRLAMSDTSEVVRREAVTILARIDSAQALNRIQTALESGSVAEKQTSFAVLGTMPGAQADQLLAAQMDKLLANEIAPEVQLDLLLAAAKRKDPAVKDSLEKIERLRPANDDLRGWRECLAGGNPLEGRRIFFERPDASCVRCHQAGGEGGTTGPDLTGIGGRKTREYLLESIVHPNKHVAQGFENVIVSLRNGGGHAGVIKAETAEEIDIDTGDDGVVRIRKSDILRRERGLSGMPEELKQVLSKQDMRDLVEFLASSSSAGREPNKAPGNPAPAAAAPAAAPVPAPPPAE